MDHLYSRDGIATSNTTQNFQTNPLLNRTFDISNIYVWRWCVMTYDRNNQIQVQYQVLSVDHYIHGLVTWNLCRLERLQRTVGKVQTDSGVCEEQLNQVESLLQVVRYLQSYP